ncbi:hypothetical protein BH753_gp112 [Bacillus phage Shbh1]|uniref:DUF7349 domain-containing protein n=1 Tax=Bacillus phage Shbh1 TaxID=1796992 RepID=A0A142F1D7_9CAUD|nr:hypothetical protein BH753_gp112 [Bacillus phage Shbh1]AMQ66594.1 hypothetical protein [Bacillus phage Shbh1]
MLVNENLAGKKVATPYGTISFNDKGESHDLNVTAQKSLGKLKSFKYVEDRQEAPKKETKSTVKEDEDTKEEVTKQEPKKRTPRKRATTKKEEEK